MTTGAQTRPELAALRDSLAALLAAAQSATPQPDNWPPSVILGHLSQVDDDVWAPRVAQMVEARRRSVSAPTFHWWESQPGSTESRFGTMSLTETAAELSRARTALIDQLAALPDDEWTAIAHHDTFGVVDVVGLVREILAHDHEHLEVLSS